jgi:hypothetical protein
MTPRLKAWVVAFALLVSGCASAPAPPAHEAPPPPPPQTPIAPPPPTPQVAESPLVRELSTDDGAQLCADIDAIVLPEALEASGMCQNVATFDVVTNLGKARRGRITKAKVRASCRKSFGRCMKKRPASTDARVSACTPRPLEQCGARVDELLECVRAKRIGDARRAERGIDDCDAVSEAVATGKARTLSLPAGCEHFIASCPGL